MKLYSVPMNNQRASQSRPSRLAALNQFTERQRKPMVAVVGFVLIGLMGLVNYRLTALRMPLPIYYVIPILGLAWFIGWRTALVATLLSSLINFLIDFSFARNLPNPKFIYVSSAAIFVATLFAARGIATLRLLVEYYYRGDVWRAMLTPIRVGQRIIIIPARVYDAYAQDAAAQPSDIPLLIAPGMAFGTGSHPTTRMCLALLETYLKDGDCVFDLGCGSGILSIAAAKLGASSVLAADIDSEAERVTRENLVLNGVADKVDFRLGSLEVAVDRKSQNLEPQHLVSGADIHQQSTINHLRFSITIANILAHIIIGALNEGLAQTLTPDGTLILSGIRAEQTESIVDALRAAELRLIKKVQMGDWVALAARFPDRNNILDAARAWHGIECAILNNFSASGLTIKD